MTHEDQELSKQAEIAAIISELEENRRQIENVPTTEFPLEEIDALYMNRHKLLMRWVTIDKNAPPEIFNEILETESLLKNKSLLTPNKDYSERN